MSAINDMVPPIKSESTLAPEVHMLTRPAPGSLQANLSQPSLVCEV